ncbi:hypothetical protein [Nocardia wallacei]|uniref:hypothetical protein n=1 Tax=Nocardia wallacei TaxID=480035 RepID=UPI00245617CB|nr:hypothetical protein [Nocardia wallacei]
MTTYYQYASSDGKLTKSDDIPRSGYFTGQERPGGEVTLYQANPDDPEHPIRVRSWSFDEYKENGIDYRADGTAFHIKWEDNTSVFDRDASDDRNLPMSWSDFLGRQGDNDPKTGDKFSDWKLEIPVPPGRAVSNDLKMAISVANDELRYLMYQMGTQSEEKPSLLISPETNDQNHMDKNLSQTFMNTIASGETADGYMSAITYLEALADEWNKKDSQYLLTEQTLGHLNGRYYKRMWDRIQTVREQMWDSMKQLDGTETTWAAEQFNKPESQRSTLAKEKENVGQLEAALREPGIQHVIEERPLFNLIREAVVGCRDDVVSYVDTVAELPFDTGTPAPAPAPPAPAPAPPAPHPLGRWVLSPPRRRVFGGNLPCFPAKYPAGVAY